jgi:hypothetical protein
LPKSNALKKADRRTAWELLQHMLEAVPNKVNTILMELPMIAPPVRAATGDLIQFAELPKNRNTIY